MIERSKKIPLIGGYDYTYDPDKPYDICIACAFINNASCDGPNFALMTAERRCEWLQARRLFLKGQEPYKWSYDYIAEEADVAKNTVISIFVDPMYDPRISTLQRVLKVVVNGSGGKNPCPLMSKNGPEIVYADTPETVQVLSEKIAQLESLQNMLDNIHGSYKEEMEAIRAKAEKIADYLKQEIAKRDDMLSKKDRIIEKLVLKD